MLFRLFDNSVKETQIDFEKFYREYFSYVFDLISAKIDNKEDSEDIAADIFAELWKKRENLSKVKYIKSYLKRIVENKCAEYYKARKTINTVSISEDTVTYEDFDVDYEEIAKQVISMLPEKDKELYKEIHINKKSLKQVSEEKLINYVSLRKRYSRLREKIIATAREML